MRAAVLAIAILGCDRAPSPQPSPPAPRPSPGFVTPKPASVAVLPATACPRNIGVSAPWSHELFPGCAPPPFAEPSDYLMPALCGADCPSPCAVTLGTPRFTIAYDARGAWQGIADLTCTRDTAGQLASCTAGTDHDAATRDASGRLTGIGAARITYDAHGDLTAIDAGDGMIATYAYDAQHRLIRERERGNGVHEDFVYRYADDHVVARTGGPCSWTYRYDPAGRLIAIDAVAPTDHGANLTIAFAYDALGRPIGRTMRDLDGNETTRSFDYACKP